MIEMLSLKRTCLIKIGNTGVYISVFTLVSAFFVLMSEPSVYTLIVLLSILSHESGHIFALKLCKTNIKKICIYPFGVDMKCNLNTLSYTKELFVVLSGAFINVIICIIAFLLCVFVYSRECLFVAFCNAFYAFSNLIPIKCLDGGRALYVLLCMRFDEEKAYNICNKISTFSYAILFLVFLLTIFFTKANFSMIILLCFFAMGTFLASHLLK